MSMIASGKYDYRANKEAFYRVAIKVIRCMDVFSKIALFPTTLDPLINGQMLHLISTFAHNVTMFLKKKKKKKKKKI